MKLIYAAVVAAIIAIVIGGAAFWVLTAPKPRFAHDDQTLEGGDAKKGRLVFAAGDCSSCHASPGQKDRHRLGGGMALGSPYGIFRVPNISMDEQDGIGRWSAADLGNALLSGVSPAGQHYYPVFPYPRFAHMDLADVKNLIAFLRTLPKVKGRAPPHDISVVFKIRRMLGIWKLFYFHPGPIESDLSRSAAWNRGRYLVESVAHCTDCHSSRNVWGAVKPSTAFAGAKDPEQVGFIPNITPAAIGDWTVEQLSEVLKSGVTPSHGRVGSSMADVVTNTAMLPQSDRDAIAIYIKSLPARATPKP